jgi:hypothetical protein
MAEICRDLFCVCRCKTKQVRTLALSSNVRTHHSWSLDNKSNVKSLVPPSAQQPKIFSLGMTKNVPSLVHENKHWPLIITAGAPHLAHENDWFCVDCGPIGPIATVCSGTHGIEHDNAMTVACEDSRVPPCEGSFSGFGNTVVHPVCTLVYQSSGPGFSGCGSGFTSTNPPA